jgi:hypothetical protein
MRNPEKEKILRDFGTDNIKNIKMNPEKTGRICSRFMRLSIKSSGRLF